MNNLEMNKAFEKFKAWYAENKNSEKKEIKIVSGDGDGLNISPVREHINIEKPHEKPNKDKIIIPEEKK